MTPVSPKIPARCSSRPVLGQEGGAVGLRPVPQGGADLVRRRAVLRPREPLRRRASRLLQEDLQLRQQGSAVAARAGLELLDDGLVEVADQDLGHGDLSYRLPRY